MMTLRTLLLGALVTVAACTPTEQNSGSIWREQMRQSAESADTSVAGFLGAHGFRLDSVMVDRGSHLAVLGRRASDDAVHLFALRRTGPTLRLLGPPDPMMENYAPQRVDFLALGGSETDAFFYTHDIPVEGVIGTAVYAIQADSIIRTYGSDEDNECRPAALQDVNGDGRMELVTYTQDPSDGHCGSECHLEMDERFGMGPQWVDVYEWTGSRWKMSNPSFPAFYADLARRYREVGAWLADEGGTVSPHCQTALWRGLKPILHGWAERAEAIARSAAD